jgi:AraC-like DNA-binding protein
MADNAPEAVFLSEPARMASDVVPSFAGGYAAGSGDLVERARAAIADRLNGVVPTIADIAKVLGVSARTLQRRLHERQQSMSRLLDEVRKDRVMHLLARGASTKAIAEETGFGDVPALYRAFRRWTGTTPRRYEPVRALQSVLAPRSPWPVIPQIASNGTDGS